MPARKSASTSFIHTAWTRDTEQVLDECETSRQGLDTQQVQARLERFGYNILPRTKPPTLLVIFLRQFLSPLIYILLVAALVSLLLKEYTDAGFIVFVLLINAVIGAYQEFTAQRSAEALNKLVAVRARTYRDDDAYVVDGEELVPGDIVLLESGMKVPTDLRMIECHNLETDESLLTGEFLPVSKQSDIVLAPDCPLGDRINMVFAGTTVVHGRGRGVVVGTGLATQLGRIASSVISGEQGKPPLVERMEKFTMRIALFVGIAVILLAAIALSRGMGWAELFFLAVALAVSAIPEGLPVALTVALAVGTNRMAKRNVIVRQLVAVEALGSCTFIATDKTGTLTVNQMTVRQIRFPKQAATTVTGEGMVPEGLVLPPDDADADLHEGLMARLCRASVLANEAFLAHRDGQWVANGDAVDAALLVLAHKVGLVQNSVRDSHPELDTIPFEPEHRFAASLNQGVGGNLASVKGAVETVLEMCSHMATPDGDIPLQAEDIMDQVYAMGKEGYRVLAMASGPVSISDGEFSREDLKNLTFLGLVGMMDPLRPDVREAVAACRHSGIQVSMVTGDHPITALAIARDLDMASDINEVITGAQLAEATEAGEVVVDKLTANARVFARMEPHQKLEVVQSLARHGHYVAVTGDGANDAPALQSAHVGVAMGLSGTDVARETADLIITDDNFASIVSGIEEGRIAYSNVRKVIYLLISTGAAEIVLFALALGFGLPLPLGAVQLLWLNLVTNGIQHVGLAFEPAEGDEMKRKPRPPSEPIFNRIMLERVLLSAVVIGTMAFAAFYWMLAQGYTEVQARNACLLFMVLFENVQAFNSRSETMSIFVHNPLRNRLLLFGTLAAQLIHIAAMYTPGVREILGVQPVSLALWTDLFTLALSMLLVMELHKLWWRWRLR